MLLLVSVSLIKIYAGIVVGQPGTPGFARPQSLGLALLTIVAMLAVARLFKGTAGRLAVLIGLAIGTCAGWAFGLMPAGGMWGGPLFMLPTLLPFGMPRFDVLAALPLLIFSAISMAEATGQTVAVGEITGKKIDMHRDVPRTIRGDAVASLLGSLLEHLAHHHQCGEYRRRADHRRALALCDHNGRCDADGHRAVCAARALRPTRFPRRWWAARR